MNLQLWKSRVPGILYAAAVAAVAFYINTLVSVVSALLFAIIAGVILRNVRAIPAVCEPGMAYTGKTILRLGVVLLGLKLSVPMVLSLGWQSIVVIVATVTLTYLATLYVGQWMGISFKQRILVATGTSICGAAAVAAMTGVVDQAQDDDDTDTDEAAASAVAGVTIYGTLAMFVLPVLATKLGMSVHQAGVWIGSGIHEVGQVVAAGGFMGDAVQNMATPTKLGRVALLGPLVAIVGILQARRAARLRRGEPKDGHIMTVDGGKGAKTVIVPGFVLGFLVMVGVRSTLTIDPFILNAVDQVSTYLLTMAMVAMGAGVRIKNIIETGGRTLALGGIAAVIAGIVPLVGVLVLV